MPRSIFLLSLFLLCLHPLHASAPPPIVDGATSQDGRTFVHIAYTLAPPSHGGGQQILATTYTVLSPIITGQRPHAPLTLLGSSWSLTLARGPYRWPMVSNDGATLLLLYVDPAAPQQPFLDIYRHTGATPSLVRTLLAEDLWTTAEINPTGTRLFMITGSSPLWFILGSLRFSPDNHSLLVCSPQNHSLRIDLHTGSVTQLLRSRLPTP